MPVSSRIPKWLLVGALLTFPAPVWAADLYKYVPNDSDVIITVDVHGLLDAPLVKQHAPVVAQRYLLPLLKSAGEHNPVVKRFLELNEEGITKTVKDPAEVRKRVDTFRKDLSTVVLAGKLNGNEDEMLYALECSLDTDGLADLLKAARTLTGKELKTTRVADHALYEIQLSGTEGSLFIALVEKGVVILSPKKAYTEEALAKAAGKLKPELAKDVQALLDKSDRKQSAWVVMRDREEKSTVTGGLTVADDIRMRFVLTAKDAETARKTAHEIDDGLTDVAAFADALAALHPELKPLGAKFRTLKPVVKYNQVIVEGEIEGKVIGQVLK